MNVVPLPVHNINDLPAMLRKLADGIEAGEYEADAIVYVMRCEDGCYTGLLGKVDEFSAIGLLTVGAQFVSQIAAGDE